jgi:hypothetical protein
MPTNPTHKDDVSLLVETGEYLVDLVKRAVRNEPIRDMDEAIGAFRRAAENAQSKSAGVVDALTRWRDNLKVTQSSPVAGDPLCGAGLGFVIEQLDSLLASSDSPVVVGEVHRCPNCQVRFQRIDDVDEHLSALKPTPTDTADRREAIDRDIRTAIWNAAMNGGMGQDVSQAFINRAMDEPLMKRAIASLIAGPVPEGFVAVPVEPTNCMVIAGAAAVAPNIVDCPDDADPAEVQMRDHVLTEAAQTYRAMIAARPTGES